MDLLGILKIVTQVLTGISGLIVLILDYKWHDKRTKCFRRLRKSLIVLFIISLIAGTIFTILDEKEKKQLKSKLKEAQTTLTEIKSNTDTLKSQIKPFLDLASSKYPYLSSNEALRKLKSKLDSIYNEVIIGNKKILNLSSDLDIEKRKIRSFEVSVYIEFYGKWEGIDPVSSILMGSAQTYVSWSDTRKVLPNIDFCSSSINFKKISSNVRAFENTFAVESGKWPLGELTDVLTNYNQLSFRMPFSNPEYLADPLIEFTKIRLSFLINGSKKGELVSNKKMIFNASEKSNNRENNAEFTIDDNLVKLLNMDI